MTVNEKSVYAVVDEVEDDILVLLFDDEWKIHLPRRMAPEGTREGTVIKVTFTIDPEERRKREKEIEDIQQRLLKRTRERER